MRLFLAVQFDKKFNQSLIQVMHDLKKSGVTGNYVPGANLHMTLVFIGETNQAQEVKDILKNIPVPPARIKLYELQLKGNLLHAEVKGNQKLKSYVSDVKDAFEAAGIPFDKKKFMPHITLVRKAAGNYKGIALPKEEMTVSKVSLLKSVQKDGKRIYTEIAAFGK